MRARKPLRPRKRPIQERSQFTVEQILEGAAHILAKRGYAGTTTNHIAERAGVSIGSLYQYFPNKDAILVALLVRHMESASEVLERMMEEAVTERLSLESLVRRFVRKVVEMHSSEPGLHHVLLYEGPRPPELAERLHRTEDNLGRTVERLLAERRGISRQHARHAAYLLVHVVEHLAHEYVVHPPQDMAIDVFVEELASMLYGYVSGQCSADLAEKALVRR
jgi:AcrR family transcriptional regulator